MKVVVIGGGVAGLGAATYAAKAGHDVVVLEAADQVGGRAKTLRYRGDICDVGTQYYHSSYTRALGLMRDVGMERTLTKIQGTTRFFDGRATEGSFLVGHRLPWFAPAGTRGNLRLIWNVARLIAGNRIQTFALADKVPAIDSVRALDVITDRASIEFMVRALTVAGAITEPEPTDVSLLHIVRLLRIIVLTDYLSCDRGNLFFHEQLAERLDVRLGTPATGLVEEAHQVVGVEVDGETLGADHVIVATPPPAALRFVPDEWTAERAFLESVRIPPFAFPTFFLDRPLEKGVWSYMAPWGEGHMLSCMLDAAQKNPKMAPSGKAILQPWPSYPAWERLKDLDDAGIVEAVLGELELFFPQIRSWIEHVEVTRHPYAVPFHAVGHQARATAFLEAVDQREGVSFVGDYLSGGYVEPALWTAERAVRRLGTDSSTAVRPS